MQVDKFIQYELIQSLQSVQNSVVLVAVSGGIDSMVLLQSIASVRDKYNVHAITVNHALRDASQNEAEFVHDICVSYGIQHKIAHWIHDSIDSGLQQKAREARYELIHQYAQEIGASVTLTAHHLNDNIAQIIISMIQGSGVYSMTMPKVSFYKDTKIIRPFLNVTKEQLKEYAETHRVKWMEDSSNASNKYLRNRINQAVSSIVHDVDFCQKRIITSIANMERAFNSLNNISNKAFYQIINSQLRERTLGYIKLQTEEYIAQEPEIRYSLLAKLLQDTSGNHNSIRLHSIEQVDNKIISRNLQGITLHGCKIELANNDKILIYREFRRDILEKVKIDDKIVTWDNRYNIYTNNKNIYTVARNNKELYAKIRKDITEFIDEDLSGLQKHAIIMTFPTIVQSLMENNKKILAIPLLSYYNEDIDVKVERI